MNSSKTITSSRVTRLIVLAVAATGIAYANLASAGGNPVAGKQKAASCVACHGEDGQGVSAEFPKLAGQYASYLEQALKQYKNGKRKNAIMAGFAAGLSEKDMQDLAAYYAAMKSDLVAPTP